MSTLHGIVGLPDRPGASYSASPPSWISTAPAYAHFSYQTSEAVGGISHESSASYLYFVGCKFPTGVVRYIEPDMPELNHPVTVQRLIEASLPRLGLQDASGKAFPVGRCSVFKVRRNMAEDETRLREITKGASQNGYEVKLHDAVAEISPFDGSADKGRVYLFVLPDAPGEIL